MKFLVLVALFTAAVSAQKTTGTPDNNCEADYEITACLSAQTANASHSIPYTKLWDHSLTSPYS